MTYPLGVGRWRPPATHAIAQPMARSWGFCVALEPSTETRWRDATDLREVHANGNPVHRLARVQRPGVPRHRMT